MTIEEKVETMRQVMQDNIKTTETITKALTDEVVSLRAQFVTALGYLQDLINTVTKLSAVIVKLTAQK